MQKTTAYEEIGVVANPKNNRNEQPAEEIRGTTLLLEMEYADENIGSSGTAFFVTSNKIATNCHLLLEATAVIAKHVEADVIYTVEGVMAFDTKNDLAILKVSDEGIPFQLGDGDTAQPGEPICVLGYPDYPEEAARSKAEGTLIGFLNRGKRGKCIRFKAPVRPGYSGGPMLNSKGEVIAVHQGTGNRSDDGIAIPLNALKALLIETASAKVEPLSVWQKRLDVLILAAYNPYEWGSWYKRTVGMLRIIWHVVKSIFYGIHAVIKESSADYPAAILIYDKAIASKNILFLELAYACRGMAKSKLGAFQDGLADAHEAILCNSESYVGYHSRGYVSSAFGKSKADQGDITEAQRLYQAAINDCAEAIHLKPEKAKIYNTRGWAKYLFGQLETEQGNAAAARNLYQEAISDVNEALRLKPKGKRYRSAFFHTRGVAKIGLSDYNGAIEDFSECIRLNPKKALYYHDRGKAKEARNQHEAAEADFAKAKELDPDFQNK